jgi:MarR family transcriptional regulator, organic hydroperoxide resistance regulator
MPKNDEYFNDCLYFVSNKLARLVSELADASFGETGLSPSYAFLMMIVLDYPGITPNDVAVKLDLAPSTITRFLDRLEKEKLVKRTSEKRNVFIYPTKKGISMKKVIEESWNDLAAKFGKSITADQYKMIVKDINGIYDDLLKTKGSRR